MLLAVPYQRFSSVSIVCLTTGTEIHGDHQGPLNVDRDAHLAKEEDASGWVDRNASDLGASLSSQIAQLSHSWYTKVVQTAD